MRPSPSYSDLVEPAIEVKKNPVFGGGLAGSVARITFVIIAILLLITLTVMARNVYVMQTQIVKLQKEVINSQAWVMTQMDRTQRLTSQTATYNRKGIASMRDELEQARKDAEATAGRKHDEALATVQRLQRELRAEDERLRQQNEQMRSQLSDVRQVVDAKMQNFSSDVSDVKSEVATTKTDLGKTLTDLRRVIGDLGVVSGRVATNARELEALRALGDRNYTQFVIGRSKEPQRVAGIGVLLKRTDPSGRKYTLNVYADEERIQKKDKTVNEPVQFYVADNKQPYELVVNEVRKDQIVGYLATPKAEER
jgi:hypothetical protein